MMVSGEQAVVNEYYLLIYMIQISQTCRYLE
jgi:hypothetical protein